MDQDVPIESEARGRLYYDKDAKMIRGTPDPRAALITQLADALERAIARIECFSMHWHPVERDLHPGCLQLKKPVTVAELRALLATARGKG